MMLAFTFRLLGIAMAELIPGMPLQHALGARTLVFIQLALATAPVLWGGAPFFERALASLRTRNLNMFTLIGMGVAVAYGYSLVATLAPQIFPASLRGEAMSEGQPHV